MKVHFIGVGKMGLPMALNIKRGGAVVYVSDPSTNRLALSKENGLEPTSIESGVAQANVVISSLPNDAALISVAKSVAELASSSTTYIDTSTVSVSASAEAARFLEQHGIQYLRATVSGNNKMAEAAQLTSMVSGPYKSYEKFESVFRCLGPNVFWLGEREEARLMKLVINHMIAQTTAMLAEALTFGSKGGLAWNQMWQVITSSAVASPIIKAKAIQLSVRDFTPTFTVEQMVKDVDLILEEGARLDMSLPQISQTHGLLYKAVIEGDGALDYAAIIRTVEHEANLKKI